MERLKSIVDHRRLQEPIGKLGKELAFQSVLANHDAVRAYATIAMTRATIFDVTPASLPSEGGRRPSLAHPLNMRFHPRPKLLGDDSPFWNFDSLPIGLGTGPGGPAARAIFALNAAVWLRRSRLLNCSPLFAILGGLGTEPPLIRLSKFPRPAYGCIRQSQLVFHLHEISIKVEKR